MEKNSLYCSEKHPTYTKRDDDIDLAEASKLELIEDPYTESLPLRGFSGVFRKAVHGAITALLPAHLPHFRRVPAKANRASSMVGSPILVISWLSRVMTELTTSSMTLTENGYWSQEVTTPRPQAKDRNIPRPRLKKPSMTTGSATIYGCMCLNNG